MPRSPDRSSLTTTDIGRAAESRALRYLEIAGLLLLARNYRCRAGEIDLVMLDPQAQVLVLVEVRSRSRSDYGHAAATISHDKQRRCSLAARHLLLTRRELRRLRARFDVVAIDPPVEPGGAPVVTWIRNAFPLC
jgi:putative endonuclease